MKTRWLIGALAGLLVWVPAAEAKGRADAPDLRARRRRLRRAVRVPGAALRQQRLPAPLRQRVRVRLDDRAGQPRLDPGAARRSGRPGQAADRQVQGRHPRALAWDDHHARVPGQPGAGRERGPLREHRRPDRQLASGWGADAGALGRPRHPGSRDHRRHQRHGPQPDARRVGDLGRVVRADLQVPHRPGPALEHRAAAAHHALGQGAAVSREHGRGRPHASDLGGEGLDRAAQAQAPRGSARHRGGRLVGAGAGAQAGSALRVRAPAGGGHHASHLSGAVHPQRPPGPPADLTAERGRQPADRAQPRGTRP